MAQTNGSPAATQAGEKAIALDGAASLFREWKQAEAEAAAAKVKADLLKEQFRSTLRTMGAGTGTINGIPVLTRRKTSTFRGKDFAAARPDLAEQYTRAKVVDVLDVDSLKREHPGVYQEFLAEALRPNWAAFEKAILAGASE